MDWNDMKDELRKIRAPREEPGVPGPAAGAANDLIARLKAHEAEERAKLKQSRTLFLVAIGFTSFALVGLSLSWSGPLPAYRVLHQGALLAAFVYIALGLQKKLWNLARVDYTQPARSFLAAAERRYVFMTPRDYVVMAVGLLLLGVASAPYVVGLFLSRYVSREHYTTVLALYCLFYLLVAAMGFYFTHQNWRRDRAPLLADIRRLRNALENNEDVQ
ncbi:MAG: hypothetical protein MUC88_18050 [Planctomycetes bacterium]|jgi:hypothetical protein|nr:hypothetical protein [Planctomycetota bacterium]